MIGRDEAATLHHALRQVADAARPEDGIWFVDSASADGSAEVAEALGAEVVAAPAGKGRAMAHALGRCRSTHLCFIDGDLLDSTRNVPVTLRCALDEGPADMVVAEFDWPGKRLWSITRSIYDPLVGALFPEVVGHVGRTAFSGFRVLRVDLDMGELPPGFAVETHLNLLSATRGWATRVVDVGTFEGVVRAKPGLGAEIAETILDMAQDQGRLEAARRPAWDAWVAEVCELLLDAPGPGEDMREFEARLAAAAARPLPPA